MGENENRRVLILDDQESIIADFRKILAADSGEDADLAAARSAFFGDEPEADGPDGPVDKKRSGAPSFELSCAHQGDEGLDVLRAAMEASRPFALAFVDVRMPPGIDGIRTISRMWELDPDLQIVICTAYSDYTFDEIIAELGQTDRLLILKKPFDPVEVRQLASAMTEKWNVIQRERRQMDELRDANLAAQSANRAKSEFLANISHEIRTPMNALLGYVDLMCDPEATASEQAQYVNTIKRSGEHLMMIVSDVLDIARIEASRMVVNTTDFSPFELAHEACSLMYSEASERDLEICLEVPDPIPAVIESDLVRARQIILNLLGNAIKFTNDGCVRLVVRLDENDASDHRYVCFDVIDTGIGIPTDKLDTIFEAFSQADTSSTRRHGGTGLGLTISKRLALLLGGDIEVESEPGEGSRFTLRLYAGELRRAALVEYTPEECDVARAVAAKQTSSDTEPVRIDGRVLVVEDVKFNQLLIGALLRKAGATVELADDGAEGRDRALEAERSGEPFDLVLMDMQMPVLDGYAATRELRAAGFERPIVALTAHALTGDRDKSLEAGCTEYVTKPIDRPALLHLVRQLVELERTDAPLPSVEESSEETPS